MSDTTDKKSLQQGSLPTILIHANRIPGLETVTEPRMTEPRKTELRKTKCRKTEPGKTEPRKTEPRMTEPRIGPNLE